MKIVNMFDGKLRVLAAAAGGTRKFKLQDAVFILPEEHIRTRKLILQSETRTNVCKCKETEPGCE
jgi:hypothetical protein